MILHFLHPTLSLAWTFYGPRREGITMAPRGISSETLDRHQFCLTFTKLLIMKTWFLRRVFCFPSVGTHICERCFLYASTKSLFDIVVAHWSEQMLWSKTDLDLHLGPDSVLLGCLLHPCGPQYLIYHLRLAPTCLHGCGEDKMNQIRRASSMVLSPESMFSQ